MYNNPLKEQLTHDIHAFSEDRKPRYPSKHNLWVRKILYLLIGISTLAGLIKMLIAILMR